MIALFAETPALPLGSAGKYVAGAYIVFVLLLIVYVGIMAKHLRANQAELRELRLLLEERERQEAAPAAATAATAAGAAAETATRAAPGAGRVEDRPRAAADGYGAGVDDGGIGVA